MDFIECVFERHNGDPRRRKDRLYFVLGLFRVAVPRAGFRILLLAVAADFFGFFTSDSCSSADFSNESFRIVVSGAVFGVETSGDAGTSGKPE